MLNALVSLLQHGIARLLGHSLVFDVDVELARIAECRRLLIGPEGDNHEERPAEE